MQSKKIDTITNNEEQVRFEIFNGNLEISEAAAELLRIEKVQRASENARWKRKYDKLRKEYDELLEERHSLARLIGIIE